MASPRSVSKDQQVPTLRRVEQLGDHLGRFRPPRLVLLVAISLMLATGLAVLSLATDSTPARAAQVNQIIVRAEGRDGSEQMDLVVNGERVGEWIVGTSAADYVYTPPETIEVADLEIRFVNDLGVSRDLTVDYVDIGGTLLQSEDPSTVSTGTFVGGSGCAERSSVSDTLHCRGSFTYAVPDSTSVASTPPVDEVAILVRALGSSGAERIQIRINDTPLATETLNTSFQDLSYSWPADEPITSAEVEFVNDSAQRDVRVDYIEVDEIRYQSEDENTFSTGAFFNGSCGDGFDESEWLRCDGSFVYAIGGAPVPLPDDTTDEDATGGDSVGSDEEPGQDQDEEDDSNEAQEEEDNDEQSSSPDEIAISVRAMGSTGDEQIELEINGDVLATETLSTSFQTFTYSWPANSQITSAEVEFLNDSGPRDVRVDYLQLADARYESEDADTFNSGTFFNGSCSGRFRSGEWLYCEGAFLYPVDGPPVVAVDSDQPDDSTDGGSTNGEEDVDNSEGSDDNSSREEEPEEEEEEEEESGGNDVPRQVGSGSGRYSISQVIDGTISSGDGSNPNEESPMGRHDAPLSLNQGWNWAQGPTRNSVWGQLGSGASQYAEFRCAVIPELGHRPSVPFRINVREGAYYQYVNGNWQTGFNVDLTGGNHGGYLGNAGESGGNPFDSPSKGLIQWRRESDGSFSAPWNPDALMMHFWAAQRKAPSGGQTAEFLTSEVRLQQPDGQNVDLSRVKVLFQCGIDYYSTTGGQGTSVPGPGIGKYHRATEQWQPSLWVTLPSGTPANSASDFRNWLNANTPPNVG